MYTKLESKVPDENSKLSFSVPPVHYGAETTVYAHLFLITQREALYHVTPQPLEATIIDQDMDTPFKDFPHTLSWK